MFRALALFLILSPLNTQAQSAFFKEQDIHDLLAGQTAIGTWLGVPYRQWFAEDGLTFFAQPEARTTWGRWRIDAISGDYQSWWPGYDWETYGIVMAKGELYWLGPDAGPEPFILIEGQHLVFPEHQY